MKISHLRILLASLLAFMVFVGAQGKIIFPADKDPNPIGKDDSREVVNMVVNIGKIVGTMLLTDENLMFAKPYSLRIPGIRPVQASIRDNDNMAVAFGFIALIFLVINMYFGGKIVEFLKSKGRKAHFWAMRWMIFSYVNQYKKITEEENGSPGPLYRPISVSAVLFVVTIAAAVYFASIA